MRFTPGRVAAAGGALALAVAVSAPAHAATDVGDGQFDPSLTQLTLLNTNDFHGHFTKDFACTVTTAQKNNPGATFLSAGDNVGGTPFASAVQQDAPAIDFLNALGLKASAVGNHEFDRGFDDLTGRITDRADWAYVGANVYKKGTQTPALDEYKIIEQGGVRIAVVGAVTKQVPSLVAASGISGLDFGDPVAAVNRVAKKLKSSGAADVIVAEYHEGAPTGEDTSTLASASAASSDFRSIVQDTAPEVDAIFTAHTHQLYNWDGPAAQGTRPVIQTGFYAGNLGLVKLGYDKDTKKVVQYTADNLKVGAPTEACASDPTYTRAAGVVDAANKKADEEGRKPVGTLTADITTAYVDGKRDDRGRESTLSNLIAGSYVDAINKPGRSGGVDIGVMNPGGVRAELLKGSGNQITYADAAAIMPFSNTIVTKELTGKQFTKVLEQQWQPEGSSRPFLKLGLSDNVTYTYDPDAASGSRITSVTVDGKPINPSTSYTVASNSFLLDGGDNFTAFAEGTGTRDSGLIDQALFVEWIKENSPLSPSFAKQAVAVKPLPKKLTAGQKVSFDVADLDLTSVGSPKNTSLKVSLGGKDVADVQVTQSAPAARSIDSAVPVRSGDAKVEFTVPAGTPGGATTLTLVAEPSRTTVTIPVTVESNAGPTDPTTEPTDPTTEPTDPTGEPTDPTDGGSSGSSTVSGPPVQTDTLARGDNSQVLVLAGGVTLLLGGGYLVARRRQD